MYSDISNYDSGPDIFYLTLRVFYPGVQKLTITPDRGTTFDISNAQVKGCKVCTGAGRSRRCVASLLLKDNTPVAVEFECSRPQDVFRVEINRSIGKSAAVTL